MQDTQDWATWEITNNDGTVVLQKQSNGYESIDREKMVEFRMIVGGRVVIAIPFFKPGQGGRLIWRRRVQVNPEGSRLFYLVGKRGAFVALLIDDGSIIIDDKFSESLTLMGAIEPVTGEDSD